MTKHIELNDKELKKLSKGLLEIQSMAFYGYNNNKDNQEQIDEKARELLRFINLKLGAKVPRDEELKLSVNYSKNEEPKVELKTELIGSEGQKFSNWEELYKLIKPYEVDGWKYSSKGRDIITNRLIITFARHLK